MKNYLLTAMALLSSFVAANAQTPVWSTDVAPILYNHCTSCHRPGGIAPLSLTTYGQAFANAGSIKTDVQIKKMPPWPPDANYSHLAHERILSATEISTIVNWVNGGGPSGDTTLAPPVPVYGSHGSLPGTPDLIVKIPTYTSTATTGDVYQCFAIPSGLLADKYITAIEAIPGNPACVHHVLVYADTSGACASLDAASPGPGYPDFGGVGSSNANLIGAWVPGSVPTPYPLGFGSKLYHNSDIVLQIHYPAGTAGMIDSTEVHFFFSSSSTIRDVYIEPVLNFYTNINATLAIPANTTRSFNENYTVPTDFSLIAVAPHMHLIGQSIKSYVVAPAGDTDKLIDIPKWDFHWQGFYIFPKLRHVPGGSHLRAEAFYDNTSANPENPHSPPIDVAAGENTSDEMMLVYFIFALYQPGDENIIVDSNLVMQTPLYYHGQQLLDVSPNPSVQDVVVKCYLDEQDMSTIQLYDMQGRVVKQWADKQLVQKGYNTFRYSVADLPSGTYNLRLTTTQRIFNQKIVVAH